MPTLPRTRRSLATLIALAAVILPGASTASAASVQAPTPLSQEITTDVVQLARDILEDYQAAKPQARQERVLGGDAVFGTVNRTELAIEDHADSTITGKRAEYVIQAEYARNAQHQLDPSDVVGIRLSEAPRVLAIPIWRDTSRFTYILSFMAANHGPLVQNSYPRYWNVYADYFIGGADQLNDLADYMSGSGNSNDGGDGGGICLDPLPPSVLPLVDAQAHQVLQAAGQHSPIALMPNLSSDFLPCKLP